MAEGVWQITAVLAGGQQVAAQLDALQAKMAETNTVAGYAMVGIGVLGLAASAKWAKVMIDAGAEALKVERVMNRVFGGQGNAMAAFSRQMADNSTISYIAIGQAVNRMGQMNMSASETQETIKALTDTVGALGMGTDEFNAMAEALAAVNEQGVAGMRMFQMFARRYGIPLPDILKKQLGIDIGTDLGAMKLEGIPREKIMAAIRKGLAEVYAGGAAQALNTWGGLLEHAQHQLDMMNESSGKLIIQGLQPLIEKFDELTVGMKTFNERTGGVAGIVVLVGNAVAALITLFGGLHALGKLAWIPTFLKGSLALWGRLAALLPEILLVAAVLAGLFLTVKFIIDWINKGLPGALKANPQGNFLPPGAGGNSERQTAKSLNDAVKSGTTAIEKNTKRTADAVESLKSALVGAGQRAQRRMTDMEAETSIARALKAGIA
jgi:hypothetical protein